MPMDTVLPVAFRTFAFLFCRVLLSIEDRVAHVSRTTMLPKAARMGRQNTAPKAQFDALDGHLASVDGLLLTPAAAKLSCDALAARAREGGEPLQSERSWSAWA
jgi:hypothetical protein